MLSAAVSELVTIGSMVPFITIATNPNTILEKIDTYQYLSSLTFITSENILVLSSIAVGLIAISSSLLRILTSWVINRYVFSLGYEISTTLYENILNKPFSFHIKNNSSNVIGNINKAQIVVGHILLQGFRSISSTIVSLFILLGLFYIETYGMVLVSTVFLSLYFVISLITKKRLKANAVIISQNQAKRVKIVQEGIGGIRSLILDNKHKFSVNHFYNIEKGLRLAQSNNMILGEVPKYVVELVAILLLLSFCYFLSLTSGVTFYLPSLVAIALGAQKLLPHFQQIYSARTSINGNINVLEDLVQSFDSDNIKSCNSGTFINFEKEIELRNISFFYNKSQPVLRDINITIRKNEIIGVVGDTGCGKSTLCDVIMGLLEPKAGKVLVDGSVLDENNRVPWFGRISHVPQDIFLADDTILRNIAFGIPENEIDKERVDECLKKSNSYDFVNTFTEKLHTLVGERGMSLSGGQRQRIGIARALYKSPSLLILDEATSSLDSTNEKEIIEKIVNNSKGITIIMLAHRTSTLSCCDRVIKIENKTIMKSGSYEDVVIS